MSEYIDREAFVKEQRHLYCENCARRKGMKNGKMRFVYEIGDAPCRACGYGDVLDDLEDAPAAAVRPVVFCRDCTFFKPQQKSKRWSNTTPMCSRSATIKMPPDGFCSFGVKREES